MSAASFYLGLLLVGGLLGASWYFAHRLRRKVMPDWIGPPGFLVEVLVAIALVVVVSQLLGSFGLLRTWALLPALALCALVAHFALVPASADSKHSLRSPAADVPRWGAFLALGVTAVLVGQWASFATNSLDFGITNFDSVWYHLPFSAEMARTGSVLDYLRTETVFANWFYPQNSELLHAVPMVLTGRDFFSVLINFGWLAVALLASWCIGRPWGRSHLALTSTAVILAAYTLVVRQPGMAKNDIVAIALLLASVAVLLNVRSKSSVGDGPESGGGPGGSLAAGWPLAIAGLAGGLALGTKYTVLAPLVLITAAVVYSTGPGSRLKVLGQWIGGVVVGGGFWYLRNLIVTGNPVPQIRGLGPIELPGPERLQEARPDFSVAHYLADWPIWTDFFFPGLERGFGDLWPAILVLALVGPLILLFRSDQRLVRALSLATLGAAVAYLFTPLGASGPEGSPVGFAINLRFLIPALALGLSLSALLPGLATTRRQGLFAAVAVFLFLSAGRMDVLLESSGRYFGLAVAVVFVLIPGAVWLLSGKAGSGSRTRLLVAGSLAVLALGLSWPIASSYFDNRYRDFEPANSLSEPYRWASDTSDSAIGLAGTVAGFRQYGFFGSDLSNRVAYIGRKAPAGGFQVIDNCPEFLAEVDRAGVDYLVTSPFLNFASPDRPLPSPEARWVEGDRAFEPVVSQGPVTVWAVNDRPDPGSCRDDSDPVVIPGLKGEDTGGR